MDYSLELNARVAVVTGAASGIGKATANALAGCGARVAIFDLDSTSGAEVSGALEGSLFCPVDVTDPASVDAAVDNVLRTFATDTIDILVNNAGFEDENVGNLVEMPYEILDRILKVNTYGYIHCARSVLPHMARGGRVVNVSSVQALAAIVPGTSYQPSKTAVLGFTNALAVEYGGQGITVNTICPGAIRTEGMGNIPAGDPALDAYRKRIPMGRRGRAEEVAAAILFLCSGMASYITGATIPVDGGYAINGTPDSLARTVDVPAEDDPDS
jgi:3-oxoacyl-[acyl-carrier protein] reductase